MSQKNPSKPQSGRGSFRIVGQGFLALIAVALLGGGAFLITRLVNQDSSVINVHGSSAEGGDAIVTVQNPGESTDSARSTADLNSEGTVDNNLQPSPSPVVDTSTPTDWSLRFPLYQMEEETCSLVGFGATNLTQNTQGRLSFQGFDAFYGYETGIQGTVTPSGSTTLTLVPRERTFIVTLESTEIFSENGELRIVGETSALNCPNSEFELRKLL